MYQQSFFKPKRLTYEFSEAPHRSQEAVSETSAEESMKAINKEATDAINSAMQRVDDLMASNQKIKRAWGYQLKNVLQNQEQLTRRIVEGKNTNVALAKSVARNFRAALERIDKREAQYAPKEKKAEVKTDAQKEKDNRESLLLAVVKANLEDAYKRIGQKLDRVIAEANAKKKKEYKRELGTDELLPKLDESGYVERDRFPTLAAIFDKINSLYNNPGSTREDITNSIKEIEKLANKQRVKEAIQDDVVINQLRYIVATNADPKKGLGQNETLIVGNIDPSKEPFASAKKGATWEFETAEGFKVRIRKTGTGSYGYRAEVTGLNMLGERNYPLVAAELERTSNDQPAEALASL